MAYTLFKENFMPFELIYFGILGFVLITNIIIILLYNYRGKKNIEYVLLYEIDNLCETFAKKNRTVSDADLDNIYENVLSKYSVSSKIKNRLDFQQKFRKAKLVTNRSNMGLYKQYREIYHKIGEL